MSVSHKSPHYNKSQLYLKSFNSFFQSRQEYSRCLQWPHTVGGSICKRLTQQARLPNNGRQSSPTFFGCLFARGGERIFMFVRNYCTFSMPLFFPLFDTKERRKESVQTFIAHRAYCVSIERKNKTSFSVNGTNNE